MKILIFPILFLSIFLSCVASKNLTGNDYYRLFPAFEWESFIDYRFYWAVDNNDSSLLIVTKKDKSLPQSKKYEKIVDGHSYKLTLNKIDSSFTIKASVDAIVNDENGILLFKDNHFLIPLYSSHEIYDLYIKLEK